MSLDAKRRAVLVLLALFALWPLAHQRIVETHRINPWRLFGWAMYTVPVYQPEVRFYGATDTRRGPLLYPADDPRAVQVLQQFQQDRSELGRLADPEPVARELFARHPRLEGVVVEVYHPFYDPEIAGVEIVVDRYPYRRPTDERAEDAGTLSPGPADPP